MSSTLDLKNWCKDRESVMTLFVTESVGNVQDQCWGLRPRSNDALCWQCLRQHRNQTVSGCEVTSCSSSPLSKTGSPTSWLILSHKFLFCFSCSGQFLLLAIQNPDYTKASVSQYVTNNTASEKWQRKNLRLDIQIMWAWIQGESHLHENQEDPRMSYAISMIIPVY